MSPFIDRFKFCSHTSAIWGRPPQQASTSKSALSPARPRINSSCQRGRPTPGTGHDAELPIEDVLATSFPWCAAWAAELKQLFAVYVEAKQRQNVLDYDDLLLYWAQMVSDPTLAGEIGERFEHVLVDEYQDTNRLQASILLALKPGGRGLTVVGGSPRMSRSSRD